MFPLFFHPHQERNNAEMLRWTAATRTKKLTLPTQQHNGLNWPTRTPQAQDMDATENKDPDLKAPVNANHASPLAALYFVNIQLISRKKVSLVKWLKRPG